MIPFLDLKNFNLRFKSEFLEATAQVLERGWFVHGLEHQLFENEFASFCGVAHGVGLGNGLDAIALILRGLVELGRLQPGDEVIVPGNTFIASALAVTYSGLTLKLVEPNVKTFNLDPSAVEQAIGPRTRVILAVHLYGRLADMNRLQEIAQRNNLILIEDAAQAHGACLDLRRAGSWGLAAAFSFFPGKPLGALGDGGMVVTDDNDLAECIRSLRNYGSRIKYQHEMIGVNSRLDELQAAFLRVKLKALDLDNQARKRIAQRYCERINNASIQVPESPGSTEVHAWHLFVIRCEWRDELRTFLKEGGIETHIHYPVPIHRQNAYAELSSCQLPVTERLSQTVLSLPIYPGLSIEDVDRVVDVCNEFSRKF